MNKALLYSILFHFCLIATAQTNYLYFDNYTTANGLSDNYLNCTLQDSKGWIWIGTASSIERFDGVKFKRYFIFENDTIAFKDILVRKIFESSKNELYVCCEEIGLAVYNKDLDRFERVKINNTPILTDVSVKDLKEDKQHNLWAATKKGVCKIDFLQQECTFFTQSSKKNGISSNYVRKLLFDHEQNLWIATNSGLDKLNLKNNSVIHYKDKQIELKDDILELYLDSNKLLWVGTANNSIITINFLNDSISQFIPDKKNNRCYKVNSITQNKNGKYWIGTRGGLYIFNPDTKKIKWIKSDILNSNLLIHNSIIDIYFDLKGDAWVSTRGGLSHMVQEKQIFKNYKALPGNNKYLNNSEIYCIWENINGDIWIGTEDGGINILDRNKGSFKYLTKANGLTDNCIKTIHAAPNGKILIGTFHGGLNLFNPQTKTIKKISISNNTDQIGDEVVWTIKTDNVNNIWIGSTGGLDRFIPETGTLIHYQEIDNLTNGIRWITVDHNNDLWLGSNVIQVFRPGKGVINTFSYLSRELFIDSKGRYWLLTDNMGIILFDKTSGPVKIYDETKGLICNTAFRMHEDSSGKLWISTPKGLSSFDPEKETFRNFYDYDGLAGNHYNYGASCKSKSGELFFGGKNGLTIVNPTTILENNYIPPVYLTDFKIFNKSVKISKTKDAILNKAISETKTIKVPYKFNVLTFDFAALNYSNSKQNKYKYMLEGFDNNWTETEETRSVTYTNLNPGAYTLKIQGSNDNNLWNVAGCSVNLIVTPPFYKKFWFISLITLFILSIIVFILYLIFKRKDLAKTYQYEKNQAAKLQKLDQFKHQLFTKTSNEIKTPLSLIFGALKNIQKEEIDNPAVKKNLLDMDNHIKGLMNLVYQLMDFHKIQNENLNLDLRHGDIVRFCKGIFESFYGDMAEKNINYNFFSVQPKITTDFDPDKIRKAINNLISNAIQYNKKGGTIDLSISMIIEKSTGNKLAATKFVKIKLEDTGIGMDDTTIANIFNRSYNDKTISNNNSGFGLAFTKELIELHNGNISAESEPNRGSTFTILLPFTEKFNESININKPENTTHPLEFIKTTTFKKLQQDKKVMLIVEDNEDLRFFLKSNFEKNFLVLDTSNGEEGLELAYLAIPNIIISDIMMPGINGIDLCERVKTDHRTSHIPFILLSALDSKDIIKKGLAKGADDYILKPFDIEFLDSKINNFITTRKSFMDSFKKDNIMQTNTIMMKSLDEKFLEKAIKFTEKNIADPDLNIDMFVDHLNISRMQLYRKFAALTNMTVKEFVNDLRLKRAEQIFKEKKVSVSEVAYGVGFKDLSYFGKCFKQRYGMSPSEYNQQAMEKKDKEQPFN